ncbi:hypothetical protein MHYP_G00302200 [Metynnis hypsauchen]
MIAAPTASRMVHFCPLPSESRAGVERGGAQTSELQCGTPSSSEEGGRSGALRLFRAGVDENLNSSLRSSVTSSQVLTSELIVRGEAALV